MEKLPGCSVVLLLYLTCMICCCWSGLNFTSQVQAVGNCRNSERDALMTLKKGFKDLDNNLFSWRGSTDCCEWPGIRCDNISLYVTAVDLSGYGLRGSISTSLMNLEYLTYLDLSLNYFGRSPIPEFFGSSLSNLRYLNLSKAGFGGMVTPQLGTISNLEYLDLSVEYYSSYLAIESLDWLTRSHFLKHVALDGIDMSKIESNWLEDLNKLSQLNELRMSHCRLTGSIASLSMLNFTSLSLIDFGRNSISSTFPNWILNISSIRSINLGYNNLYGKLPTDIDNMEGAVASSTGKLCNLRYLTLEQNKLNGNLPAWLGQLGNLIELELSGNSFEGPIPSSLGASGTLKSISLARNNLNGTVPEGVWQLAGLSLLNLNANQLSGVITEAHFRLMTNLNFLSLSSNSFTIRVGPDWVPPFHVHSLDLGSCLIESTFPSWLKTQTKLIFLDLSNTSISGGVPSWFWNMSDNLDILNLSFNRLRGKLPNPLTKAAFWYVNLSSNLFHGPIPLPAVGTMTLLFSLSDNRFTGSVPPYIGLKMPALIV